MIKLKANEERTKNGGLLSRHERWYYKSTRLAIVNNFC